MLGETGNAVEAVPSGDGRSVPKGGVRLQTKKARANAPEPVLLPAMPCLPEPRTAVPCHVPESMCVTFTNKGEARTVSIFANRGIDALGTVAVLLLRPQTPTLIVQSLTVQQNAISRDAMPALGTGLQ